MAEEKTSKRDDLRLRLLDAAEARIATHGLMALRARDVTGDAGCALGGLYTAFDDLDLLVLHVNSRTLARLGAALQASVGAGAPPQAQLGALAQAYLTFALSNPQLWAALFDHKMPPGRDIPDWHLAEHAVLIAHIAAPLAQLQPQLGPDALAMRARTLFSAVHGIVKISLEQRFIGTPAADLSRELAAFVGFVTVGMGARR